MCRPNGRHVFLKGKVQMIMYLLFKRQGTDDYVLTFVQPEKIEIDANERAVNEKSQYCFFVCTTFDSFLNDLSNSFYEKR